MIKVGLTGGIGSGKTTVARIFRTLGIPVFEADAVGRLILTDDREAIEAIEARFGHQVFKGGRIERSELARIVFADPDALRDLNAIIHPAVRNAFRSWAEVQEGPYVLMEAAILAETAGHQALDQVIVVTAPEPLRLARVVQRDGVEEKSVRARMANQTDETGRLAIADHVIHNDDQQLVIPQVLRIHEAFIQAGH